jgi:hypothetical protein
VRIKYRKPHFLYLIIFHFKILEKYEEWFEGLMEGNPGDDVMVELAFDMIMLSGVGEGL